MKVGPSAPQNSLFLRPSPAIAAAHPAQTNVLEMTPDFTPSQGVCHTLIAGGVKPWSWISCPELPRSDKKGGGGMWKFETVPG